MSAADPEAPSQDVAAPSHLRKRVQKEKQCSKGWKKVYFTGSETKRKACLYSQATQGVGRTTVATRILKAAIKVPDQEQRSPPLGGVITKGHPREERKSCPKVKVVPEVIGNLIQGEDENAEDVQMADHLRPMEELLRIPIVGIENDIVVPAVLADEFELKTELLDFVCNNSFFGLENDDPHSHIRRFYQITRTLRLNQVLDDVVKLILFSFSLKGAAETWLENEPPNSITYWDDLVSKFLNRFFPHSKTRELRKEITNFQQVFGETFTEAWERFKDLLRKFSSSSGTSTQIDAITALTKQVEALISSMQEAYNRNQEASIQLMQNQMGQMEETFQERPSCVPPSDTETYLREERKAVTTMSGLTLDGSFIPHSDFLVYQEKEQEPETITEVVEVASSQSTPLVPPPETLPLSTPKPKENLKPNPHQPPIPSRLQEEKFQALKNSTGRADYFVYRIDIVDSLCDKFPIENNSLSPTTDVREEDFDIKSPLGEYVVDFMMENEDVAGLPRDLVKRLFSHLLKNLSLTKGMSDEPLGDDSKPRSYDVTFSNPLFDFNDDYTLCYDNLLFDEELEDIITPLPDPEQICLREVERFDHFFSLTQLRGTTRVMETPSFGFHHMPSPCPAAYSPKEVMYCYYHPHLTTGDGFDPETKQIPSGKSKVHIEVLSVLWGNRLLDHGRLAYRCDSHLKGGGNNNNNNNNCELIKAYCLWSIRCRCGSLQKKAHSKNNKSETDKSLLHLVGSLPML
ncbi:reverse transcriptase domain-containing protein [Tanacetum coccineum]|uniref:Reverse transcriptase domain-containing protein n=1 Tax=Tanacetum coccineum TaxID=301880 RepID=A0ABQ4WCM7_9ASTR